MKKLGDEGRGDERVEVHVEPVEKPAKPGGNAGLPLCRRKVAQADDSRLGSSPGGFRKGLDWGWPVHVYWGTIVRLGRVEQKEKMPSAALLRAALSRNRSGKASGRRTPRPRGFPRQG